jgi:hypothetical protein
MGRANSSQCPLSRDRCLLHLDLLVGSQSLISHTGGLHLPRATSSFSDMSAGSCVRLNCKRMPTDSQEIPRARMTSRPGVSPSGPSSRPRGSKKDETCANVRAVRTVGGRARAVRRFGLAAEARSATDSLNRPTDQHADPQLRPHTTRPFATLPRSVPRHVEVRRTCPTLARENLQPMRRQETGRDSEDS